LIFYDVENYIYIILIILFRFDVLRNFSVVCLIFTSDTIINAKVIMSLILFVHVLFFIYCFNVNQTQTSSCKFVLWLIEFVEISSGSFTHSFCKYLPPRISCTLLIQIVRRFYFYFPSSRLLCGRFRFRPRKNEKETTVLLSFDRYLKREWTDTLRYPRGWKPLHKSATWNRKMKLTSTFDPFV